MVEHGKRKKFHDKDKYYRLAKEQGLRSRAAFKLSQINRKFRILENARVILDLCAAPGGWTQIASKTASKQSLLVAVDILPIRSLGRNVITLVGDITTDSCKSEIKRELQGAPVDVVLHDGAPNVGASFDKDAYEQNEIALHALRCATQHLRPKGTFVTKLYRSRDYASYVWVAKQLFKQVQAVKPTASRSQSAEIFLVCQEYLAPDKLDPRMLDPKCIFEQVEGDSTGGGNMAGKNFNVFHKSWDAKRRQRDGYDMQHLDATMRHVQPVSYFVDSKHSPEQVVKDPIALLSTCTGMTFSCPECSSKNSNSSCHCQFLLEHPQTTLEIKACLTDLKVLNKSDFKGLLTWRTKMQDALKKLKEEKHDSDGDEEEESAADSEEEEHDLQDSDKEEDEIQAEIAEMRRRRMRERKKLKKKERAVAAKRRKRAALGMDLNAIDVPDNEKIFTLATITSKGDLEAAREVDLGTVTDKQLLGNDEDEEDDEDKDEVESQGEPDDLNEETGYSYRLDKELDEAYDLYLKTTKDGMAKSGTKMAKRSKKLQRQKALEQANEDAELMLADEKGISQDTKTYAKMLQGGNQDDDSEEEEASSGDEDDDDGFHADPKTPEEHAATKKKAVQKKNALEEERNPLIYKLPEDPSSVKTARWFSNPLFESIGNTAQLASMATSTNTAKGFGDDYDSDEDEVKNMGSDDGNDDDDGLAEKKKKEGLSAEDVLAMMPKTDKQIRHERRLKALEREERKKARRAKRAGEDEKEFEVAPSADKEGEQDDEILNQDEKLEGLSEAQKKKILEARALIKAGMGESFQDDNYSRFEVVSAGASDSMDRPLPIMDKRKYDSDNEDYDSDDYAQTLALGTMMLRRSKAKALVDASYNRYAWNDPSDLPDWFVDDENKHYRPQLPIPPALLQKMKDKVLHLSTKPIAKVAEARARKNKRARTKLAAAKKKAEAVAHSSEMTEAMKLKAISKAMRGQDAQKTGRAYVVSKKGGGTKGVKGAKMVDKRMKSDKRGMDRAEKKRKGGKAGGKTKRRRR